MKKEKQVQTESKQEDSQSQRQKEGQAVPIPTPSEYAKMCALADDIDTRLFDAAENAAGNDRLQGALFIIKRKAEELYDRIRGNIVDASERTAPAGQPGPAGDNSPGVQAASAPVAADNSEWPCHREFQRLETSVETVIALMELLEGRVMNEWENAQSSLMDTASAGLVNVTADAIHALMQNYDDSRDASLETWRTRNARGGGAMNKRAVISEGKRKRKQSRGWFRLQITAGGVKKYRMMADLLGWRFMDFCRSAFSNELMRMEKKFGIDIGEFIDMPIEGRLEIRERIRSIKAAESAAFWRELRRRPSGQS